ncbi:hypothetical protein [Actinomadura macra]|uniref:hypothetical protein n=1 Tax=Actinomadura macra TaxID=46164 RepID=UPI00082FE187|nr:hypothetical protein [Actinomadura macra]
MNSTNGPAPTPATHARQLLPLTVWLCPDDTTGKPTQPTAQPRPAPARRAALTRICDHREHGIPAMATAHEDLLFFSRADETGPVGSEVSGLDLHGRGVRSYPDRLDTATTSANARRPGTR